MLLCFGSKNFEYYLIINVIKHINQLFLIEIKISATKRWFPLKIDLIYRLFQKWLTPKKGWWLKNRDLVVTVFVIFLLLSIIAVIYIYSLRKLVKRKSQVIKSEIKTRTETEGELLESEDLRKKMENFTSVMLVETDLDNNITQAPKLFYSILGFEEDEIVGANVHQLLKANL
jgi:PAS domain-containing protein